MSNIIEFSVPRQPDSGKSVHWTTRLSPREREVLERIAADPGVPNKIIAWQMGGLSENTVRALLRKAFAKSGLRSRWEIPMWMERFAPVEEREGRAA